MRFLDSGHRSACESGKIFLVDELMCGVSCAASARRAVVAPSLSCCTDAPHCLPVPFKPSSAPSFAVFERA
jgi:hypothetical protein